jgi:DNA (cytosine-5)-methyltransferase 1
MIEKVMEWGDLFAGGGGTTTGALAVNRVKVMWALNHSKEAIYTHQLNHPETTHYHADIRDMDEHKLCKVDGLWASLECTNFSNAKGGLPREGDSRTLAWELVRYITWCRPKYIIIENFREFLSWGPLDSKGKPVSRDKGKEFIKWVNYVKNLGYPNYDKAILNSADFGAYTARKRLFLIFSNVGCEISFPKPLLKKSQYKACKEKINLENTGDSIFGRKKPLAEKTLQRIAAGIRKFYPEMAHVMQYYGNGYNGQSINKPLNTITTKERHGLIQFVANYSYNNKGSSLDGPLATITTKESHALVQFGVQFNNNCDGTDLNKPLKAITTVNKHALASIESNQFITEYYGRDSAINSIDDPLRTITTAQRHALTTLEKKQFVSDHIWGSNNQDIEQPLNSVLTKESKQLVTVDHSDDKDREEKFQFITKYFSGVPWQKNDSIDAPLSTITTVNRHALATVLMNGDFDIKLRFLTPKELADITGFPEDYKWYGSNKFKTWMIGNAVPILLAKVIIHETKKNYDVRRCEVSFRRDDESAESAKRSTDKMYDQYGLFEGVK